MLDVIVVGAGPAGNHVAYRLAGLGYDVAVLDWRHNLGDKPCTGIVGKTCIEQFPVDDLKVFKAANSARFFSPSGDNFRMAKEGELAYVIDRVAFVSSLARKAQSSGAKYFLGHRVFHAAVDEDSITAKSTDGEQEHTFEARAAVIACGFGSNLPKRLGLGNVGDFTIGAQVEVATRNVDEIEVYFGNEVAPGFFAWLVPTTEGRALLGLLSRHNAALHLKRLTEMLEAKGKVESTGNKPRRWGVPLRPLARTYGPRVVVVGDAAGQAKPTTGGGIYYALLSADTAAEALHKALRLNDFRSLRLSEYERRWKALLAKELRVGYYARRLYEMLGDRQIDYLLRTVATNGIHEELINSPTLSFDWHADIIHRAMRFKNLARVINSLIPLTLPFRAQTNGW